MKKVLFFSMAFLMAALFSCSKDESVNNEIEPKKEEEEKVFVDIVGHWKTVSMEVYEHDGSNHRYYTVGDGGVWEYIDLKLYEDRTCVKYLYVNGNDEYDVKIKEGTYKLLGKELDITTDKTHEYTIEELTSNTLKLKEDYYFKNYHVFTMKRQN